MDFWWTIALGTIISLSLVFGFVLILLYHERTKQRDDRRYRDLFHGVNDLIYVHSPEGILLQINRSVAELLLQPESEIIGRSIKELLPGIYKRHYEEYLKEVRGAEQGREIRGMFPLLLSSRGEGEEGGMRIIEYRSKAVRNKGGKLISVSGVARDQTTSVRYQQSLRKSSRKMSQLYHQSETMRGELSRLSQRMMQAQEEDRLRISRELHDEVGQTLTAISLNMEIARRDLSPHQNNILARLAETQTLAKEVIHKVHGVIKDLRPAAIDALGLGSVLATYIKDFETRSGIHVFFHCDPMEEELNLNEKYTLYRIIQECLTNIVKHSHATMAHIVLFERDEKDERASGGSRTNTYLEISDNGSGLSLHSTNGDEPCLVPASSRAGGAPKIGLLGIQERVKLLSGTFQITSHAKSGTQITIVLPRGGNSHEKETR